MDLPSGIASLKLDEVESKDVKSEESTYDLEVEPGTPRVLRKRGCRAQSHASEPSVKRLCMKKMYTLNTDREILDYYRKVNQKCTVRQTNLETIYEEPKESGDGNVVTMSAAKVKRSLAFRNRLTKAKKAKRNAKVKRYQLTQGKAIEKKKKMTLEEVKLRLAESLDSWETLFESSE